MNQQGKGKPALWNDWISSLLIDSKGMLWIGTAKGLSRLNTANGDMSNFSGGCLLPDIRCTALTEADNGDIYIGTNNGLHRYSYKTNTVELVDESRPLEGHEISCLYVEKNGDVWMGTTNGICTEKRI